MPPTEEAAFKSLKHPAQGPFCGECGTPAASQWRGTVPPDEERIRRDARDAAVEDCAKEVDEWERQAQAALEPGTAMLCSLAKKLRSMKVEVPRE